MNAQLRLVGANRKLRGAQAAAMYTLWGRAFSHLADACAAMSGGAYASAFVLLRFGLEAVAAQKALIADAFAEYEEWFAEGVTLDKGHAGVAIDLGRHKGASMLAADERLGLAYRLLMDLSLPHFGPAALLAAPEAGPRKLSPSFAENRFHYGLAQLAAGWLLLCAREQVQAALDCGLLAVDDELAAECKAAREEVRDVLDDRRRCYVEEAGGRYVFQNFRRSPAGQPKRVVLRP
jgi:hypothetical protein